MGLNLGFIGKKIGDVLGGVGAVAQGVERQINPFDGGATYANPHPQGPPAPSVATQVGQAVARPFTGQIPGLGVSLGQIGSQIPNATGQTFNGLYHGALNTGDALLGGVGHLADTINYPINERIYRNEMNAGRITPQTYLDLTNQSADKAGINMGDQGLTLARKATGAVAGPTATILTVGTAPKIMEGANLAQKAIAGAKLGAKVGAGFGGISTLTQKGPVTLPGAAANVAGGAISGAALGALAPVAEAGASKLNASLGERGSVALGPNLENPQALAEIKQGNASSLAKSFEGNDAKVAQAQQAIDRAATAKNNPVKVTLGTVGEGGYQQAIANSQVVSRPLDTASSLFKDSMQALKKASPEEYKNFWANVENPNPSQSPELQKAIAAWRAGADRAHAGATTLGKGVGYVQDYARHPWDLAGWAEANQGTGGSVFTKAERLHPTIAEGEAAGLKLTGDPLEQGTNYLKAAGSQLRKDALSQGLQQADAHILEKPMTLDLGNGVTVPLSKQGMKEAGHLQVSLPTDNPIVKGIRAVNRQAKGTLLSASQFHPVNISALRAAPTLAMEGHPVAAAKGLYGTFRAAFGSQYADQVIGQALKDGTVEKAARIGMPFGSSEWNTAVKTIGEHTVFGKQMPMMHNQVARSIIADLEKRGVPLDSPEAQAAGKVGNNLMGFVNQEVQGISPKVQRAMSDWLLAGQFTPAKLGNLADARLGGVAGSYARRATIANVAATTALATGIGYLVKQNSDNIRDIALRALVDPAVPTPFQDAKGNTVKLRMPGTNTSDIAKLIGVKLVRQDDGHLGVSWNPGNMPSTIEDWMRSRLSPLAGAAVKLKTNTSYAGKVLYDPNAPAGTKAIQAATSLVTGDLPIGLQGLAYTQAVKDHVPGSVKQILDANTPGSDPLLKSVGASFGLTAATDQTVGKGLSSARYYDALGQAKQGLDRQAADAIDLYAGSKKNPVTGAYDVQPNVNDARTKASALLQNPSAIDSLANMNQTLASQGETVDPLWKLPTDQIKKYLEYQAMPPGGADKSNWYAKNQTWYAPLVDQRNQFFASLPAGDPNKPKLDLQYPDTSPQLQSTMDTYSALTDPKQKGAFLDAHPELVKQWNAQADYTNKFREALGYSPFKGYPEASPQLQSFMDKYNSADKTGRKGIRNSNPQQYQNMISYFDSLDLYNINKQGAVDQLQGSPDQTSKQNKAISSLAKDIYQNPDGTYSIIPAGWMQGLSNSSSGSSSYSKKPRYSSGYRDSAYRYTIDAGAKPKVQKASAMNSSAAKSKKPRIGRVAVGKPKVAFSKSKV